MQTSHDLSEDSEIGGSADFYTINYTDSTLGTLCALVRVPATSCLHGVRKHALKRTHLTITYPSLINIMVTVLGTNRLGMGSPLNSTFTGIIIASWHSILLFINNNNYSQHNIIILSVFRICQ